MPQDITVSLQIENSYELFPSVTTTFTDETVAAPESYDEGTIGEWAMETLFPFTGVGHQEGNSWYDVLIFDSSDPALIGREFHFGDY